MQEVKKPHKPLIFYYTIALVILLLFNLLAMPYINAYQVKEVDYGTFMTMTEEQNIGKVEVMDNQIVFTDKTEENIYKTGRMDDPQMVDRLYNSGAEFASEIVEETSPLLTILLYWVLPLVLFIALGQFMSKKLMDKASGGANSMMFNMGKSNAKVYVKSSDGIRFSDVAGVDEAKENLAEIVDYLHNPDKYRQIGASMPKGVLLVGPPGTGKTMLAKAVATESEANFIAVKGPEFLNKWVGESEKAVRETFRKARQASPCVIFMDEIDSITPERGTGSDSNVTERVISQMLTEMDGLEALNNVVVIAATNRPDIMDPALLRPGRFDKSIYIGPPDQVSREKIFKIHTAKKPLDADVDLSKLAEMTEGCTGADISAICNEAVMCAVRELVRNSKDPNAVNADECKVHMKDFEKAVEKFGPKAREKLKEYNH